MTASEFSALVQLAGVLIFGLVFLVASVGVLLSFLPHHKKREDPYGSAERLKATMKNHW